MLANLKLSHVFLFFDSRESGVIDWQSVFEKWHWWETTETALRRGSRAQFFHLKVSHVFVAEEFILLYTEKLTIWTLSFVIYTVFFFSNTMLITHVLHTVSWASSFEIIGATNSWQLRARTNKKVKEKMKEENKTEGQQNHTMRKKCTTGLL